jgi:hypothetical protein
VAIEYDKLAEKLGEHIALILVPLGVLTFWLGSAGGFKGFGIEISIQEPINQALLQVFGVAIFLSGVFFIFRRSQSKRELAVLGKDYGFHITFPDRNGRVESSVTMQGTVKNIPPDGSARVVEYVHGSDNPFFSKSLLAIDPQLKTWSVQFHTSGKPGERRTYYVVISGESGKQIFEFQRRVGMETGKWLGLRELPPDSKKCAQVQVELS